MKRASSSGKTRSFSWMSASNIMSDESSCFQSVPGLSRLITSLSHRRRRYSQCARNEHPIPDMTPGTMSEVVTEPGHGDALDISSSDVQLRLFLLQMLRHKPSQVCYT